MKKIIYILTLFSAANILTITESPAQIRGAGDTIICFDNNFETDVYVSPPEHFEEGVGAKLSKFVLDFEADVPPTARSAIRYAADIWSSTLESEVPIRVDVRWDSLGERALASAGPTNLYRSFPGVADPMIWYPVSLAEAITGQELNETLQADIAVNINSETDWYFGLDGNTPFNRIDLVSVILHELAHGLGFLSSAQKTNEDEGQFGFGGILFVYDLFIRNRQEQFLTDTTVFPNPSEALLREFTGDRLFFSSDRAAAFNAGIDPQLFAPSEFDEGSSISHLDEFIFRSNRENALMTPRLARSEAIHDPGKVTVAILEKIGWNSVLTSVEHPSVVERSLRAFPNPTAGLVRISMPSFRPGTAIRLSLIDMKGRRVFHRERTALTEGATLEIDLATLPSGAYLLTLTGEDYLFRTRVVRQ